MVRLAMQNFTSIGARGWVRAVPKAENVHFLVRIRPAWTNSQAAFYNVRAFYVLNYPA